MDRVRPFVGKHSPRVQLAGNDPRGFSSPDCASSRPRPTKAVFILPEIPVQRLWSAGRGQGGSDSQTVPMPALTSAYQKFPFRFTPAADSSDARLEIVGTGTGVFHIGTASLMAADNVQGFHAGMIRLFKEEGFKMFKWPGGNFVSAYDWRDGLGDRDERPPRGNESNDVGL